MDILRKMFKMNEKDSAKPDEAERKDEVTAKDEFRKPQWFEEAETDDELFDDNRKFAFQIFTNPLELQKHFERQMQQILEAVSEFEGDDVKIDKDLKEDFLKPGFENIDILKEFEKKKGEIMDTDLDGEIYADQLHSLMQRLSQNEELPNILPRNDNKAFRTAITKRKLTDEEKILGRIHGTLDNDDVPKQPRMPGPRPEMMTPMTPMIPRGPTPFGGGVFEGTYQGPKMFSQSVMSNTIRKPDGSYETTKITKDSQGNTTTTITRTIEGKSETVTAYNNAAGSGTIKQKEGSSTKMEEYSDRNISVTKEGYAVPRNLW
ncbi:uncharacterized protein LOC128864180 [Anastrepha ludens]|uniref:uncharacterized protein LOC128864180 n=1 Tax=Anastrepha ludens TaxID=28586 RepID=UPI0023AF9594|nr:uncharacterized protein LOC128864180 [Anastrepha ludens]XP_053959687.1 uncharacterized protein LOC128864180 [Anastrepha ludens]XP_053959689.1 uncharacterized protein LOC128864180 [Anastrepha ludens]